MAMTDAARIAIDTLLVVGAMTAASLLVGVLAGLLLRASRRE